MNENLFLKINFFGGQKSHFGKNRDFFCAFFTVFFSFCDRIFVVF